jgi:hypothetical protein
MSYVMSTTPRVDGSGVVSWARTCLGLRSPSDARYWHLCDILTGASDVRLLG